MFSISERLTEQFGSPEADERGDEDEDGPIETGTMFATDDEMSTRVGSCGGPLGDSAMTSEVLADLDRAAGDPGRDSEGTPVSAATGQVRGLHREVVAGQPATPNGNGS